VPIILSAHFMSGDEQEKAVFRGHASEWTEGELGQLIEFEFNVPIHESRIRVDFTKGGGNMSTTATRRTTSPPSAP
jgi:hypothetical protein